MGHQSYRAVKFDNCILRLFKIRTEEYPRETQLILLWHSCFHGRVTCCLLTGLPAQWAPRTIGNFLVFDGSADSLMINDLSNHIILLLLLLPTAIRTIRVVSHLDSRIVNLVLVFQNVSASIVMTCILYDVRSLIWSPYVPPGTRQTSDISVLCAVNVRAFQLGLQL